MATVIVPAAASNAVAFVDVPPPSAGSWSGGSDPDGTASGSTSDVVDVEFSSTVPPTDDLPSGVVITAMRLHYKVVASVTGADSAFVVRCPLTGNQVVTGVTAAGSPSTHETTLNISPCPTNREDFIAAYCADPVGFGDGPFRHVSNLFQTAGSFSFVWANFWIELDFTPPTLSPTSGGTLGGDTITVSSPGGGFTEGTTITFDGLPGTSVDVDPSGMSFTCLTPAHDAGLVDVVVTRPDTITFTLPDGFQYIVLVTVPLIDAGPSQVVLGPPGRSMHTHATVTRGSNNGTLTYLWEQIDGPSMSPVISFPTAKNTDIVFGTFVAGVYTFKLTVTTESTDIVTGLVASATTTFVMGPTVAPRVSSGTAVVEWPDTIELFPIVTDDGWGGALSYVWVQVSGPGTAVITPTGTFDPAYFDHDIFDVIRAGFSFPDEITGIYVFTLTVTRADALSGVGYWKVAVIAGEVAGVENVGPVTIEINGDAQVDALLGSTSISKSATGNYTCNFKLYNVDIAEGNDVTIARGGKRLFGGICLSTNLTFDDRHRFYQPSLVGYGWHLGRVTVTKTYEAVSISDIVADLLSLAPGGITGDFIAPGLQTASIAFVDKYIDACIAELAALINGHFFVDDFKKMHFAVTETVGDPLPLWDGTPFFQDLQITKDLGAVVNRVKVNYTVVTTKPIPVDSKIEVSSLDGYSPTGGVTTIDGNTITYTGLETKTVGSLYGTVEILFTLTPLETDGGDLIAGGFPYVVTCTTENGETPAMSGSGLTIADPQNAIKIRFTAILGSPDLVARLRGINVYRDSSPGVGTPRFIGTIPANGGSVIDDTLEPETFPAGAPVVDTSGVESFFLTGCTGTLDSRTVASVTVNDTDAQDDLAARLGGPPDNGVVSITLEGGDIPDDQALALANAYLASSKDIKRKVTVTMRDDDLRPGQTLVVYFPDDDITEGLLIQDISLTGFEMGVPHLYRVTAARDSVTLNDLIRHSTNLL